MTKLSTPWYAYTCQIAKTGMYPFSCMTSHTQCHDRRAAYSNPYSVWPKKACACLGVQRQKVVAGWADCQETSLKLQFLAPFGAFQFRSFISATAADHEPVRALAKKSPGTSLANQCIMRMPEVYTRIAGMPSI